jgi:hypothetical protein
VLLHIAASREASHSLTHAALSHTRTALSFSLPRLNPSLHLSPTLLPSCCHPSRSRPRLQVRQCPFLLNSPKAPHLILFITKVPFFFVSFVFCISLSFCVFLYHHTHHVKGYSTLRISFPKMPLAISWSYEIALLNSLNYKSATSLITNFVSSPFVV